MEEFLNNLRKSLNGRVTQNEIDDTLAYYREYILGETGKGRTMDEVLLELGDPSLIARSVITASKASRGENISSTNQAGYSDYVSYNEYESNLKQNGSYKSNGSSYQDINDDILNGQNDTGKSSFSEKMQIVKQILRMILIIFVIVLLIAGFVKIAVAVFVPVLIIVLLWKFFSSN